MSSINMFLQTKADVIYMLEELEEDSNKLKEQIMIVSNLLDHCINLDELEAALENINVDDFKHIELF